MYANDAVSKQVDVQLRAEQTQSPAISQAKPDSYDSASVLPGNATRAAAKILGLPLPRPVSPVRATAVGRIDALEHRDAVRDPFVQDVMDLFSGQRAGHVCKWLYDSPKFAGDKVNGSYLWDKVYQCPDYYLPSSEKELLRMAAADPILRHILTTEIDTVFDLGPGSADCVRYKSGQFLQHLRAGSKVFAVDVSSDFVAEAISTISHDFPTLDPRACVEDFDHPRGHHCERAMVFFFGGTMFNVAGSTRDGLPRANFVTQLHQLKQFIRPGGYLLVSQDTTQDEVLLARAYKNASCREFMENIVWKIARDVQPAGTFDPAAWEYAGVWQAETHQFAHRLRATVRQEFVIGAKLFEVAAGQIFEMANSYKLPEELFTSIAEVAGFASVRMFRNGTFVTHLLQLRDSAG